MRSARQPLRPLFALLAIVLLPSAAPALTLGSVTQERFDELTGAELRSAVGTYDFPATVTGGDGLIASTVFSGADVASGANVFSYQIELFESPPSSVAAVVALIFEFDTTPLTVDGIEAFSVLGSGNVAPSEVRYGLAGGLEEGQVAFLFVPEIRNGELSTVFGLVADANPRRVDARVVDSGAPGGDMTVLGTVIPEPTSALVFGVGLTLVAGACRSRRG